MVNKYKQVYGDWEITYNPKPIGSIAFDYDYSHKDHDGENCLCGVAGSFDNAIKQIKDIEESWLEPA